MSNSEALKQYKATLEQLGEFDMGPVARITYEISKIIDPIRRKILDDFLVSEKVYENDATRMMLLSIIDECLAAETN